MDFLNIQDGGWLASLSFNILEAKHVIKKIKSGYYRYFQGYYRKVKKKIYCHIPLIKHCSPVGYSYIELERLYISTHRLYQLLNNSGPNVTK